MSFPGLPGSWEGLLKDLAGALGDAFAHRNDPKFWTAQIEKGADEQHATKHDATVESVSIDAAGFTIKVKTDAGESTWHASPGANGHPIKFDGTVHSEANLIYRPVPSEGNPARFHLDIRWVKVDGQVVRLDTQFPNGG